MIVAAFSEGSEWYVLKARDLANLCASQGLPVNNSVRSRRGVRPRCFACLESGPVLVRAFYYCHNLRAKLG